MVSQLSEEKGELRGAVNKLEDDIWQLRQTQQSNKVGDNAFQFESLCLISAPTMVEDGFNINTIKHKP